MRIRTKPIRSILVGFAVMGFCGVLPLRSDAGSITPLASYEPSEMGDLVVTRNPGDVGLSISIVRGGDEGAPAATDGQYVLRIDISGETDRKIEFRHSWSSSTYDLAGQDELLADVYVASEGAIPGIMGIWSLNWSPPDAWQPATCLPTVTGVWTTISFNVSNRSQTGLNYIWAFIFEDMAGTSGVAYVDNLRFLRRDAVAAPTGIAVNGYADRNEILWKATDPDFGDIVTYNIYRASKETGPFIKLNATPLGETHFSDPVPTGSPRYFYYVVPVVDGNERTRSDIVSALYNGLTDDELLDSVQQTTFGYCWDAAHPVSGMAREGIGFGHPSDTVTTGGTGMCLMNIVVAAHRGFVSRNDAAGRVLTTLRFLDQRVMRYHGAWAHWYNGATGATIPFAGPRDNGGDLVETAFLVQGLLTVRQYFDSQDAPTESEIRSLATAMWEGVEWSHYRQFPDSNVLYWHWSPDFGFVIDPVHGPLRICGYNEAMVVYLLAIASPTHPMPAKSFREGWAGCGSYLNGSCYFGFPLWVGPPFGGPLFFTHYSNLGFDPRYKRDIYANYYLNARNITLINRAYCIDNPRDFVGYSPLVWGLTASFDPWGYSAHSPTDDTGTITPTAAISAMPYTPQESLAVLRHLYDAYGSELWGPYGFYDAFNPSAGWFACGYAAIDQGTIVPMIENYRTGLCWRLFMSNPEIGPMMQAIGMTIVVDFDSDSDVDLDDWRVFRNRLTGPEGGNAPVACSFEYESADLDLDNDVDLRDVAIFQEVFDGLP